MILALVRLGIWVESARRARNVRDHLACVKFVVNGPVVRVSARIFHRKYSRGEMSGASMVRARTDNADHDGEALA